MWFFCISCWSRKYYRRTGQCDEFKFIVGMLFFLPDLWMLNTTWNITCQILRFTWLISVMEHIFWSGAFSRLHYVLLTAMKLVSATLKISLWILVWIFLNLNFFLLAWLFSFVFFKRQASHYTSVTVKHLIETSVYLVVIEWRLSLILVKKWDACSRMTINQEPYLIRKLKLAIHSCWNSR